MGRTVSKNNSTDIITQIFRTFAKIRELNTIEMNEENRIILRNLP